MAHAQQVVYIGAVKKMLPQYFSGSTVLEVGSLNINGSVRQFFVGCNYTGIDLGEGRDVDTVCAGEDFGAKSDSFDVVISCEAMEHNPAWAKTWINMIRLLKPTGLLIMTCASTGRRQHGTAAFNPADSPLTVEKQQNYYRNLIADDFAGVANNDYWFSVHAYHTDHQNYDLYFFGLGRDAPPDALAQATNLKKSLDKYYFDKNVLGKY